MPLTTAILVTLIIIIALLALTTINLWLKNKAAKKESPYFLNNALDRINSAIHSTLNFDEVMKIVVDEAAKVLGAESAALAIREDGYWSGRYQFGFLKGAKPRLSKEEAESAEFGFELTKPISISDVKKDPRINQRIIDRYHFKSILSIPLRARGDFFGVLTFNYHTHKVAFTDAQMNFTNKLQTNVSLALQNARLYETEKESAALNEGLNKIHMAIGSTQNIYEILSRAIEESAKALGCETATIVLKENDYWILRYNYGFDKKYIGMRFSGAQAQSIITLVQAGEPIVANDALHDEKLDKEIVKALRIRSVVIVPLTLRNKIIGILSYNYHKDAIAFTKGQVDFLKKVAVSLSLALENANLYVDQRHIATTLQQAVLELPEKIQGIEFSDLYRSATASAEVGGDFYDLLEIEHNKIGILIGDVSGKGLQAATLTSLIKNAIKAYVFENRSPANIIKKTNNILVKESSDKTFVSLFFAILDLETKELNFCNAGHPPPILKKSTSDIVLLSTQSPVVGIFDNSQFFDKKIAFETDDILFLYTDGVIEARRNKELFGEERLISTVKEARAAKDMPQYILDTVINFSGNNLADDLAILAISY